MTLDALLADIRACRACAGELPHEPRPVVQVRAETRILILGQAPGRRVNESGLPFDDPSGDRLRAWMGVDRATFYEHPAIGVAGMAFCYPGTDRNGADYPPMPRCATLWHRRLLAHLPKVELTLLVGTYAQRYYLGPGSMTDQVRAYVDHPRFMALPHPSWRTIGWEAKNPWFGTEILPRLREVTARQFGK